MTPRGSAPSAPLSDTCLAARQAYRWLLGAGPVASRPHWPRPARPSAASRTRPGATRGEAGRSLCQCTAGPRRGTPADVLLSRPGPSPPCASGCGPRRHDAGSDPSGARPPSSRARGAPTLALAPAPRARLAIPRTDAARAIGLPLPASRWRLARAPTNGARTPSHLAPRRVATPTEGGREEGPGTAPVTAAAPAPGVPASSGGPGPYHQTPLRLPLAGGPAAAPPPPRPSLCAAGLRGVWAGRRRSRASRTPPRPLPTQRGRGRAPAGQRRTRQVPRKGTASVGGPIHYTLEGRGREGSTAPAGARRRSGYPAGRGWGPRRREGRRGPA